MYISNEDYRKDTENYSNFDGIIAVVMWLMNMILLFVLGYIYKNYGHNLVIPVNIYLAVITVLIPLLRKQDVASIGLSTKKLVQSITLGLILGILGMLGIGIIPALVTDAKFYPLFTIVKQFAYFFFVIALPEELVFRAFIQKRISGIINNKVVALLVVAAMFSVYHLPFQFFIQTAPFLEFLGNSSFNLGFTFVFHIVATGLFARYNNIAAPLIFHALWDLSNYVSV